MPQTSTTTDPRRTTTQGVPFSQELKAAAADAWHRATRHRFVQELAKDTIDEAVFRHYLVQDHVFLDALTRLVARGVAATPGTEGKRRLTGFLSVLTSEENDYFDRSFEALGVSSVDRGDAPVRDVTYAFEDLFRAAAEEYEYGAVIAALLPVEWVYLDWARWARQEGKDSGRFWIKEWIGLHSTKEFADFVHWLRGEVDQAAGRLDGATRERYRARFVRAVELETAFFEDAYAATS